MRKKLIAVATLATLFITGLGAALAAPGTASDPFVTLSYLTGTYYEQAGQVMLEHAQQATSATEQAALDKLAELTSTYLVQAGGADYSDTFTRLILAGGDLLALPAGASLLFESGQVSVSVSGTVLDVTTGSVLLADGTLNAKHRYIVAEDSTCTVNALSDSVYLSVQGSYSHVSTGTPQTPFIDVAVSDWHRSYVRFVYDSGLFQGVSTTEFSPGTNMNRAMLVTVLSRLAGAGAADTETRFTDVEVGSWYEAAAYWAASTGITSGTNAANTQFSPYVNVTRVEMAVMLYRYIQDYLEQEITPTGDLSVYSDRGQIQSWAEPAMSWAVGAGIMTGYPDSTLGPNGSITRAEVAAMLQRFTALLNS